MLKTSGIPLAKDFPLEDMPHTLSFALIYRLRLSSFDELPKNKRPPRNLWDKPHRLSEFFDDVFKMGANDTEGKTYIDIDDAELE